MPYRRHPALNTVSRLASEWSDANERSVNTVTLGSSYKAKWICGECQHEWQAAVNARALKENNCPACAKKYRGQSITSGKLKISRRQSLGHLRQDLLGEWDFDNNKGMDPFSVRPGARRKVAWRCKNCETRWVAALYHRHASGSGCPVCGREKMEISSRATKLTKSGTLLERYPAIAAELHPNKNISVSADTVFPASSKSLWWLCPRGHIYKMRVSNRTVLKQACPKCRSQTSKIEVRLYTEIATIFRDTRWRERIDGFEADILVPDVKLAIEIDGYPWHEGAEERDLAKNRHFQTLDYKLVRLRHEKLRSIECTIGTFTSHTTHEQFCRDAIEKICGVLDCQSAIKTCEDYLAKEFPQAGNKYNEILSLLPGPPRHKSLAHLYPKIAEEWDQGKNGLLSPEHFTARSGEKIWWLCPNGHSYDALISNRTKDSGCPFCAGKKASADYNLLTQDPDSLKYFDYDKNRYLPSELTSYHRIWCLSN